MRDYNNETLSHDPIHGYITFTSAVGLEPGEVAEQQIIDHPWLQRMRQIHQLQTAFFVYPSAEHSRFQHVLGVMYMASRAVAVLFDSLKEVCPEVPSRPYVESLMRMAGLLHDVGHGPFGHFFDEHYLSQFDLTHETLGAIIIRDELGDQLRCIRRNPYGRLAAHERLDTDQITFLITRPGDQDRSETQPRWLYLLRSLFCGLYTVDNMDFVLRDSYTTGYNTHAFDLERLLHYSFFTSDGLTVHARGLPTLVRFLSVRAELFRSVYFHRTVRALDLELADLFRDGRQYVFPGDPRDHLDRYLRFTDWSLLVDGARSADSDDPNQREWGQRWRSFLAREVKWRMACERTLFFGPTDSERTSIFQNASFVEMELRKLLPRELRDIPLRVDLARHVHRPPTRGVTSAQNYLFDPATGQTRPLSDSELYRQLPISYRLCRVYVQNSTHDALLGSALDQLIAPEGTDDKTNM